MKWIDTEVGYADGVRVKWENEPETTIGYKEWIISD